jgi:hypothetical protein
LCAGGAGARAGESALATELTPTGLVVDVAEATDVALAAEAALAPGALATEPVPVSGLFSLDGKVGWSLRSIAGPAIATPAVRPSAVAAPTTTHFFFENSIVFSSADASVTGGRSVQTARWSPPDMMWRGAFDERFLRSGTPADSVTSSHRPTRSSLRCVARCQSSS